MSMRYEFPSHTNAQLFVMRLSEIYPAIPIDLDGSEAIVDTSVVTIDKVEELAERYGGHEQPVTVHRQRKSRGR